MTVVVYLILAYLLALWAYLVFRRAVRRDYLLRGRLSATTSLLQVSVFAGLFSFPYLYNPPEWPWFWRLQGSEGLTPRIAGLVLICIGFVIAFGTMVWFGLGTAFGIRVQGIVRYGPYRLSRNPQILGGYLLVIGTAVNWLSWCSLGWIVLYGLISHWMVITEEEHLRKQFGEEYDAYCMQVPRYLFKAWGHASTAT